MRLRLPESWAKSVADKQYFDEDLKQDSLDLLQAAAALEIREFKLFELSYREWYGKPPLDHVIEAHFSNYMFHGIIPAWVRSYSRRVVDLHEAEQLNPRDFGVYQPLPSKRLIMMGKVFTVLLVVVFLTFMYLISGEDNLVVKSLFGRADVTHEVEHPAHNAMP